MDRRAPFRSDEPVELLLARPEACAAAYGRTARGRERDPHVNRTMFAREEGRRGAAAASISRRRCEGDGAGRYRHENLTRHVGAGNFGGQGRGTPTSHAQEWGRIPPEAAARLNRARRRAAHIRSVHAMPLLESAADAGRRVHASSDTAISSHGLSLRAIDGLGTNLHLQRSTLLWGFGADGAGDDEGRLRQAIAQGFASILWRCEPALPGDSRRRPAMAWHGEFGLPALIEGAGRDRRPYRACHGTPALLGEALRGRPAAAGRHHAQYGVPSATACFCRGP